MGHGMLKGPLAQSDQRRLRGGEGAVGLRRKGGWTRFHGFCV